MQLIHGPLDAWGTCARAGDVMIAKDFRSAKDFPLIRGKSFAIMPEAVRVSRHSGQNGQALPHGARNERP
jgi:hypothetical protein